jgi:hypothetical protein
MHVTDVKKMVAKRVSSSPGNCSIHDQTKKFLFRSKDNNFPFFSFSIDFESKAIPGRGLGTQARIHSDRKKNRLKLQTSYFSAFSDSTTRIPTGPAHNVLDQN